MKKILNTFLVDPVDRKPMELKPVVLQPDAEIVTGELRATNGKIFPIRNGIPRFVLTEDEGQRQTSDAFNYKWKRRESYDSPEFKNIQLPWFLEMEGFASQHEMSEYFNSRRAILDIGCGSGFTSILWLDTPVWNGSATWVGLDISEAIDVAKDRLSMFANTHFVQADAMSLPFADGTFDTAVASGVLHHTPSTRLAILSGARVLQRGGEFHFYVYRRKGPVREFSDDYIREKILPLSNDEAWEVMRSLTRLGQALSDLHVQVVIPEDIPLLGIHAGEQDIQRMIYWNFAKLYWNSGLSFEENVHVNFDWYRPKYAHRQSVEEVQAWCVEAGLTVVRLHEQESGFNIRAIKT